MRWLIRKVERRIKGQIQFEDFAYDGDELTVGRGADQVLSFNDIRMAHEHLVIHVHKRGRVTVEAKVAAGFQANGQNVSTFTLKPKQLIEVGSQRLRLIDPPKGFDAAIECSGIDQNEQTAQDRSGRLPMSLGETWLSKRGPAWILFVSALVLCVLLPLLGHQLLVRGHTQGGLATQLWSTGPLANAHGFFGEQCTMCHSGNFKIVEDKACVSCHAQTKAHADPVKFPLFEVADARCAHCHRDHNGKDGLILTKEALCSDCHREIDTRTAGTSTLLPVADFADNHPNFVVSLPAWSESGAFLPVQTRMGTGPLTEKSGLKFPHDKHLGAVDGLASPNGRRVLTCSGCHVADAGGLAMQPVDFEPHCQDCHRLTFDRAAGDRQVPHGDAQAVQFMLSEYYAKRAIDGTIDDPGAPPVTRTRRRPGQDLSATERNEALTFARNRATQTTRTMFTGRACGVCHTVNEVRTETGDIDFTVAPVRVAGIWFDRAHFSHGSHDTMQCEDCHAARLSKSSADVLIPDIKNCQQCHGGETAKAAVQSTCTMCHGFHQAPYPMQAVLSAGTVNQEVKP